MPSAPDSKPRIGVLVGLKSEAKIFASSLPPSQDIGVTILASAARGSLARTQAARLVVEGATHFLSFGFAGGLDPRLEPGTLLLPSHIVDESGVRFAVDPAWRERALEILAELRPCAEPLLGADTALTTPADKAASWCRSGAASVDMESHMLARAAAGRPLLVVRAVIDGADTALPAAALAAVASDGGMNWIGLLAALSRRPQDLPALIRLGRSRARAEQALLGCVRLGGFRGFGLT